jgi:hypothetical protein
VAAEEVVIAEAPASRATRASVALLERGGGSHICEHVALKKRVSHLTPIGPT